jgi:hypothetical protein
MSLAVFDVRMRIQQGSNDGIPVLEDCSWRRLFIPESGARFWWGRKPLPSNSAKRQSPFLSSDHCPNAYHNYFKVTVKPPAIRDCLIWLSGYPQHLCARSSIQRACCRCGYRLRRLIENHKTSMLPRRGPGTRVSKPP